MRHQRRGRQGRGIIDIGRQQEWHDPRHPDLDADGDQGYDRHDEGHRLRRHAIGGDLALLRPGGGEDGNEPLGEGTFGKQAAEQVGKHLGGGPGIHQRPLPAEARIEGKVACKAQHTAAKREKGLHEHVARKRHAGCVRV